MKRPGSKRGTKRVFAGVLAAGMLATGAYAFTATNTVAASKAGDGNAAISGYSVSNVTYTPSALDPTLLSTYTFTLDAAATNVKAKAVSSQLTYDVCTNGGVGNTWTCTAPAGTTIASLDNLRVIATQ